MTGTIEQIYRQHRKGLYTLALSITRRPETAEDAVHEAVVRLCRSAKSPSGDPVAYVFAAVRNAAVDQIRKPGAVSIFELPEACENIRGGPALMLEVAERNQMVSRAIEELPEDQREAVVMHLYSELTFQQVAEALDVPLQTIASRYRRALSKLKEQLTNLR